MRKYLIILVAGGFFMAANLFVGIDAGDKRSDKDPPKAAVPKIDEKKADLTEVFRKAVQKAEENAASKSEEKKADPKEPSADEEILKRANVPADGAGLVTFFEKRTLPESQRPVMQHLVRQLGSTDYRARARAAAQLTARGVAVLEVLRATRAGPDDLEAARRIESAIREIQEKDVGPDVTAAAVRVLTLQKPTGFLDALIGFLPFTDHETVLDEVRATLTANAVKDGKAHPRLLATLTDRSPARRAAIAEALVRSAYTQNKIALNKVLHDADPFVRCRVAQALIYTKHKDAIPTLIDTLPDLALQSAWQTEDLLLRIAIGSVPPEAPMGSGKDTREKCRLGWQAWWKKNGAKLDLAKLEEPAKLLGRTLIVLLDEGKVVQMDHDNQPRWEVKNLVFPLDAQLIGDDRVLVAEYHGNKVTERSVRGDIRWSRSVVGPLVAQRLPNGNTFVSTDGQFLEFDKDGREVLNVVVSEEGRKIMKAMKVGAEIVCMTVDSRVVRFDAKGKELQSFPITLGMRLFGGRVHALPTGRVLVPHNAEGKVSEYDRHGNIVWEVPFEQPIAAMRISNGNTLITSMNPAVGAVEVDRAGNEVWSYRDTTRVTRAIRR